MKTFQKIAAAALLFAAPSAIFAQEAVELNSANTAWILTATALVLFMTLPAFHYFMADL